MSTCEPIMPRCITTRNLGRGNKSCQIPAVPAVPVSNVSLASESSPLVPVINYASANKDNEDQIASRELGENRKSAAEVLKDSIEKEKLDALFTHFNEIMDNWKNEPVELVVTGKSGVWKSAFIHAIRNLKPGYPGFGTTSSFGNTTIHATVFKFPGNSEVALHELPGCETTEFPTNEYEEKMELRKYDSVLIFVRNIEENDIEMAKEFKEMNKPVCFVRSKHDLDIENAKNYGEPAAEAIEKMKSKSLDILRQEEFKEAKFFVISNRSRRICDFNALVLYIQSNLPKLKCDVVIVSLLGNLTDDIDSKYRIFKDRIWDVSLASAGPAATPVTGLDIVLNLALICKEIWLYYNVFGFGQQIVKEISKHDYLRKKLSASSIIEIEAANEAMEKFVIIQLGKFRTVMAVQNTLGVIPPFIGPVMPELTAGKVTHYLLTCILDGCRDDAKLVYFHLMKVNEHLIRTTQIVAKTNKQRYRGLDNI